MPRSSRRSGARKATPYERPPHETTCSRPWQPSEDELLLNAVSTHADLHGRPKWKEIAAFLPGRTQAMCRNRFQRKQAPGNGAKCVNKCTHCGQFKRGHTCLVLLSSPPQVDLPPRPAPPKAAAVAVVAEPAGPPPPAPSTPLLAEAPLVPEHSPMAFQIDLNCVKHLESPETARGGPPFPPRPFAPASSARGAFASSLIGAALDHEAAAAAAAAAACVPPCATDDDDEMVRYAASATAAANAPLELHEALSTASSPATVFHPPAPSPATADEPANAARAPGPEGAAEAALDALLQSVGRAFVDLKEEAAAPLSVALPVMAAGPRSPPQPRLHSFEALLGGSSAAEGDGTTLYLALDSLIEFSNSDASPPPRPSPADAPCSSSRISDTSGISLASIAPSLIAPSSLAPSLAPSVAAMPMVNSSTSLVERPSWSREPSFSFAQQ